MIWIALFVFGCFIVWLGTGAIEGVLDAQKRPTETMEWCGIHGVFRKKHVLQFGETTICPRCYEQAFKKAER